MNAPIEPAAYECGHSDVKVSDAQHRLCVRCDSHALYLSGLPDENARFEAWKTNWNFHSGACRCERCSKAWGLK